MNALMKEAPAIIPVRNFSHRIKVFDWERVSNDLDAQGCAIIENLVSSEECGALVRLYAVEDNFRSRVVMGHHGFGRGEYKYFRYPLPGIISGLRTSIYPRLVPVANRWNEAWELTPAIQRNILILSSDVMLRASSARRLYCCNIHPATITACIKTYTASMSSRFRSLYYYRNRDGISRAANSY